MKNNFFYHAGSEQTNNPATTRRKFSIFKYLSVMSLVLLFGVNGAKGQIYFHNFGTTSITTKPYTGAPNTFASNLSNSSWTTSAAAWSALFGNGGTPSMSLSLSNSSGTPTYTLTFDVTAGFQVEVTHFNFWRVRSNTGAQNWAMTINGVSVGSGTVPTTGAALGSTAVSAARSGLTGTITVVLTMSGASGTGTFRLDDFTLTGSVTSTATPSIAFSSPTIPTSSVNNNSTNNIVGAMQLDVTTANATLNGVTFTTAGTYTATDIATNGFKFWLSTSATDISGATQLGAAQAAATNGSNITVSGLSNTITSGTTRFIVLSADIAVSPTNGATIGIASTAHSNITFASGTKTGTDPVAAGTTRTIAVATPSIAVSSNHPTATSINQNATNQVFGSIALAVTTANATLNSITITTGGNYLTTDLVASSFKLYYTTTNTFATTTQLGSSQAIVATGNSITFSGLSQNINSGVTGYLWFTADVAYNAVSGRTLSTTSTLFSNITFASGTKTGTDPVAAGNDHTIATVTPNVTIAQAGPSAGNIANNTTNQILYQLSFAAADNATDINSITLTTAGIYVPADLVSNSFKLWYNTVNSLSGATQLGSGQAIVTTGNNITFSGLSQKFNIGTSYLLLTVDVAASPTAGNTINITTTAFTNITLSAGNKLGTDPSSAGGLKTIITDVSAGDVVINQFSNDYGTNANDEFIELVNKTGNSIDLSTLKIDYQSSGGSNGGAGGTLSGTLAPYSFWLLSPNATITVGQTSSLARDGAISNGFSNNAGQFALRRVSDNTIIDGVAYGSLSVSPNNYGEGTQFGAISADGAIKRSTDGADANANSTDFTSVTNANIYLRNSSSRLGIAGSTVAAGTYTDLVVTGNTSLGGAVNVTRRLSLLGGTLTTGGNLTLKSSSTGTANVPSITGAISGNVTVERFVTSSGRRWRFLSSPVQSATIANWMTQFYVTGPGTPATLGAANSNGWHTSQFNIDQQSSLTTTSIRTYTEANATGSSNSGLNAGWSNVTTSQTLTAGQGFRTFIRGPIGNTAQLGTSANSTAQTEFTLALTGSINTGDITPPSLTFNSQGWNLLGNPYPCAYNFNAHYDANIVSEIANIDANVYVYDGTSNSYKSYNASTNSGTLTNGIIPSGAGFFIQATGSPTFVFKETYKTTSLAPIALHKTALNDEFNIKFFKDSTESDEMIVKMLDGATLNKDRYDINKLGNENLNLSAYGTDDNLLTLSAIPFVTEETRIKLNVEATEVGTYKFDFTNIDKFDAGVSVSLFDRYTNTTTDVKANTKYTFEMGAGVNQWGKNRFELILNGEATTGVNNTIANSINTISVYPNPVTDVLNISVSNGTKVNNVNIYNVSGKLVTTAKVTANQINISELNNGVYFIEVLTENGKLTTKFVK